MADQQNQQKPQKKRGRPAKPKPPPSPPLYTQLEQSNHATLTKQKVSYFGNFLHHIGIKPTEDAVMLRLLKHPSVIDTDANADNLFKEWKNENTYYNAWQGIKSALDSPILQAKLTPDEITLAKVAIKALFKRIRNNKPIVKRDRSNDRNNHKEKCEHEAPTMPESPMVPEAPTVTEALGPVVLTAPVPTVPPTMPLTPIKLASIHQHALTLNSLLQGLRVSFPDSPMLPALRSLDYHIQKIEEECGV